MGRPFTSSGHGGRARRAETTVREGSPTSAAWRAASAGARSQLPLRYNVARMRLRVLAASCSRSPPAGAIGLRARRGGGLPRGTGGPGRAPPPRRSARDRVPPPERRAPREPRPRRRLRRRGAPRDGRGGARAGLSGVHEHVPERARELRPRHPGAHRRRRALRRRRRRSGRGRRRERRRGPVRARAAPRRSAAAAAGRARGVHARGAPGLRDREHGERRPRPLARAPRRRACGS